MVFVHRFVKSVVPVAAVMIGGLAGCSGSATSGPAGNGDSTDSVNEAVAISRCVFGATRQTLDSSSALTFGPSTRLTAASTLTPVQRAHLSAIIPNITTPADFFANVLNGEAFSRIVTEVASGRTFTQYDYSAGGPQGFLFVGETTGRAAAITNDAIAECQVTPLPAAVAPTACVFGTIAGEDEASGLFSVGPVTTLTAHTSLSAIRLEQLRVLTGGVQRTQDEIFHWMDDGHATVRYLTEVATGKRFTEYRTVRGDTSVGLIFSYLTLDVVAVNSDDSLYQCRVAVSPPPSP